MKDGNMKLWNLLAISFSIAVMIVIIFFDPPNPRQYVPADRDSAGTNADPAGVPERAPVGPCVTTQKGN